MKNSLDLKTIPAALKRMLRPIRKHLALVVFVAATTYLILGVVQVNQTLQRPTDQAYQLEQQKDAVKARFDAATITQIEKLKSRQESTNLSLPSGVRINPFTE